MSDHISTGTSNKGEIQPNRKIVRRLDAPVKVEKKTVARISGTSTVSGDKAGADYSAAESHVDDRADFSRVDFMQALERSSRPSQPDSEKKTTS